MLVIGPSLVPPNCWDFFVPIILKISRWLLTIAITAVLSVTLVIALGDRRMSDLSPEHRVTFENEFTAAQEPHTDWDAYRAAMVDEGRCVVTLTPRSVTGQLN